MANDPFGADAVDWAKATLDLTTEDGSKLVAIPELLDALEADGRTIEEFKTLAAYKAAIASDDYPWLADL